MSVRVRQLAIAPVKGMRLMHPESIDLTSAGVALDRRFFCVGRDNGKLQHSFLAPRIASILPAWSADDGLLALTFPDGTVVSDTVHRLGPVVAPQQAWDGGRTVPGRLVEGAWSSALSDHVGRPVDLAVATDETGAHDVTPVTMLSDATVARLARELDVGSVDGRRFRMTAMLEGASDAEEDRWIGGRVSVGTCVLGVVGPVPRCVVTARHPETGVRDLATVKAILAYRPAMPSVFGEIVAPLGVYAEVETPGRITVGDEVGPA